MCMKATICTRRRTKLVAKYMFVVIIVLIYLFLLMRESVSAIKESDKQRAQARQQNAKADPSVSTMKSLRGANRYDKKRDRPLVAPMHRKNHTDQRFVQKQIPGPMITTTNAVETLNPIYEYSDEMNAATTMDLEQRQAHLWATCVRLDLIGKYTPNAWEFFLSPGHSLAWCNVFKAASSTWLYYFNILGGYDINFLKRTKSSPLDMARSQFPRPSLQELKEALSNSLSFLVVREPFERLLSAYRDKFEGLKNNYYKNLGEQIMKAHRKGAGKRGKSKYGPTFREFIMYILENKRQVDKFDEHWRPVYMFCTPCSVNYTVIAKVDTFQRDSDYIIRQAGLETILFNKMPQSQRNRISNISSKETKKEIDRYFSQLNTTQLEELISIYEPDFALFGYDSTKYYNMVEHPTRNTTHNNQHTSPSIPKL